MKFLFSRVMSVVVLFGTTSLMANTKIELSEILKGEETPAISQISQSTQVITSLYASYFVRTPDLQGLTGWQDVYEKSVEDGLSQEDALKFISEQFFNHSSANGLVTQSNKDFIETVYENYLNGAGEAEGVNAWTGLLDAGLSRSDFMVLFIKASLFQEVTVENYPNLSESELQAGQERQAFLQNSVLLSVVFAQQLGEETVPADAAYPEKYLAYMVSEKLAELFKASPNSLDYLLNLLQASSVYTETYHGTSALNYLAKELNVSDNFTINEGETRLLNGDYLEGKTPIEGSVNVTGGGTATVSSGSIIFEAGNEAGGEKQNVEITYEYEYTDENGNLSIGVDTINMTTLPVPAFNEDYMGRLPDSITENSRVQLNLTRVFDGFLYDIDNQFIDYYIKTTVEGRGKIINPDSTHPQLQAFGNEGDLTVTSEIRDKDGDVISTITWDVDVKNKPTTPPGIGGGQ